MNYQFNRRLQEETFPCIQITLGKTDFNLLPVQSICETYSNNFFFFFNRKHEVLASLNTSFFAFWKSVAANKVCSLIFSTPPFFFFQVPMSCRQMLLLETLGVKMSFLESFPSHLQLPVAVTCYWTRSEPKVKLLQLKALLLMIVSGELDRITNDPGTSLKNIILDV